MSKRDDRKALELRLPELLRKDLRATSQQHLPLAYLVRHALLKAFATNADWTEDVVPGASRPILLQLSRDERDTLAVRASAHDVSEEVAVLSLIRAVV